MSACSYQPIAGLDISIDGDVWPGSDYAAHLASPEHEAETWSPTPKAYLDMTVDELLDECQATIAAAKNRKGRARLDSIRYLESLARMTCDRALIYGDPKPPAEANPSTENP